MVPVVVDGIDEANESFSVEPFSPVGALLDVAQLVGDHQRRHSGDGQHPGQRHDHRTVQRRNRQPGAHGHVVRTQRQDGCHPRITTADGTAVDGKNFVGTLGKVTFNPGVTADNFTIPILGDLVKTPDETFSVQMQSELLNGNYGTRYTPITITNSDALPAISLANATITEGNWAPLPWSSPRRLRRPPARR